MAHRHEIPKASVRKIMKINDEVSNISLEAVAITAKASELFIADILDSSARIVIAGKRKTIKLDDLLLAIIENQHKYEFLNNAFNVNNK